ncbi:sialate O-acetylesterase [Lewinella sp. IMCC34183]|uniref:sialate O-acetylesterase n=1 Tax=Lewinella sp. IMCC34183 TaxID=2248762 RepID=UPI000E27E48E|nr:sialate O-acetylesterase [Lewinella sp. IMCC34183]
MPTTTRFLLLTLPQLLMSWALAAAVSLPDIFTDHLVLQREQVVPVWGMAAPGEAVRVSFGGQEQRTIADEEGKWRVHLSPMEASATPRDLTVSGKNTIVLTDILVGEVWLLTGQSNMQWRVLESDGGQEAIEAADYPEIRLFNVSREVSFGRRPGKLATWERCSPETVPEFSGVGYFFGLELYRKLGIPVGLINSSYGGSQAEAWTPRSYLAADEDLAPTIAREEMWAAERPQVQRDYDAAVRAWQAERDAAEAAGTRVPRVPRTPDALRDYRIAGSIYGNMIEPLIPYAIRGVAWYQGESNEDRAEQYEELLTTMIRAWRDRWEQGAFPFAIVQLPNFRATDPEPQDLAWSHLRDRQRRVANDVENAGLIVTIDVGEANDIHPTNKLDVGQRLARWALTDVYGEAVPAGGPVYRDVTFADGAATVVFDRVGEGLRLTEGDAPREFAVSGADGRWYWAEARIAGRDRIVVRSPKVPKPVAVRYAFNNNPEHPNLTNETGIPAGPFRTDDRPGPTHGRR